MFQVVSLLILATVVTNQVYHARGHETNLTPMPGNSEPLYNKVTLNDVTRKYWARMPGCFNGFDKEIEHKQNFGLITISSKLSLISCELCHLYRMYLNETYFQDKVFYLDITQGTAYLRGVIINCFLEIQQMGSKWNSWITAAVNEISANLTIVQADDLSNVFIIFKPLHEPKLTFTSRNLEAWEALSKYFIYDLTTYLTHVMSEKLKTTIPLYLKEKAKEFIVETHLNSSGEEIPYIEINTTEIAVPENRRCLKFTIDEVINKYYSTAPDIAGFDKTLVHTQNFALINVTSELILENCRLFGLRSMKADDVSHENLVSGFEITETTVNLLGLTINCNLNIQQMSSNISSRLQAYSGSIPGNLTIMQNADLDIASIKFKVMEEPRIGLTIDNAAVSSFVNRYFSRDLTEYLTKVMSDNLKTTVPSYLRKVAKYFCPF